MEPPATARRRSQASLCQPMRSSEQTSFTASDSQRTCHMAVEDHPGRVSFPAGHLASEQGPGQQRPRGFGSLCQFPPRPLSKRPLMKAFILRWLCTTCAVAVATWITGIEYTEMWQLFAVAFLLGL